jgi:predicted AAA+ superfamily ATPase
MENEFYRSRLIDEQIQYYLRLFGAVSIEGPKWSGKTWSALHHAKSVVSIGSDAGNFQNKVLAETDPSLVLTGEKPRLIDEWQEVPRLWDAVRHAVDQSTQKGQFILTGSSTPPYKGVLHSGVGRIAQIRMRPMSLFEMGRSSGAVSLKGLFAEAFTPVAADEVSLRTLVDVTLQGGWPGALGFSAKEASDIAAQYIETILTNDLGRVDDVKRSPRKMRLLLRSLARNVSTTASVRTLMRDITEHDEESLDSQTITSYLDVLSRLFLIENQPPFSTNLRSSIRVKQMEKRHFTDPSLAAALLGANAERLIGDLETFGFLFESLCIRDLRIYAEASGSSISHYQDYENNEIDAVVETDDGRWAAFEIKVGFHEVDKAAQNLKRIATRIGQHHTPSFLAVICGMSRASYRRDDGVYVLSPFMLRN